jgi:MFS family permease
MRAKAVQRNYLLLTLFNTLAASLIWGVNTLFLLDAGLTNSQAFAANAFFTLGQVLFEVPTGVVADTFGRRTSYLLGSATLAVTTLLYLLLWKHPLGFWAWALVSMFLGLGFTFFSGAVEAWLVDALEFTKFKGELDDVFAKGQIVTGIAMLTGSTAGGFIAQYTNLGVPYIIRCGLLVISFLAAAFLMKDLGFTPRKSAKISTEIKNILDNSLKYGLGTPSVRWIMLSSLGLSGVGIYAFYAAQPLLLQLYGDSKAYGIAGFAAALVAGAQILGGMLAPRIRKLFSRRTSAIATMISAGVLALILTGISNNFFLALFLLGTWAIVMATVYPLRQAYINKSIPSNQRATILSFDGMLGSTGGVVFQPILGKTADVYGYGLSYIAAGATQILALPFVFLARRQGSEADKMNRD